MSSNHASAATSRTYFLRWPYYLFLAALAALLLAPGLILIPSFENGDRGASQVGTLVFLLISVWALADLGAALVVLLGRVRLRVTPDGVRFYGAGYSLETSWDNVDSAQTGADGTLLGLRLRQPGVDGLGCLGTLLALMPLLSVVDVARGRATVTARFDDHFIPIEPFAGESLLEEVARHGLAASSGEPTAPAAPSAALSAAMTPAGPAPRSSGSGLRLAAGLVVAAAALAGEAALARQTVTQWLGAPARLTLDAGFPVTGVAFSPDGQTVAGSDNINRVTFWRLNDGGVARTLPLTLSLTSLALSADNVTLATGTDGGGVALWDAQGGELVNVLQPRPAKTGARPAPAHVAFSPDGRLLAAGLADGTLKVWRVEDGALLHTLGLTGTEGAASVNGLAFSPDGQWLAAAADSLEQPVTLWRVADGARLGAYPGDAFAESVAFAPDGHTLVAASLDGGLWVLSAGPDGALSLARRLSVPNASGPFVEWMAAVAPDGQTAASVTGGGVVQVWRLSDGALLRSLRAHTGSVRVVAFSADGQWLATGGYDDTVRVWAEAR